MMATQMISNMTLKDMNAVGSPEQDSTQTTKLHSTTTEQANATSFLNELKANSKLQSLLNSPFAVNMIGSPATAFPETSYTQKEVGEILHIKDPVTWKMLRAPHIQKRHLYLPAVTEEKRQPTATERNVTFMRGLEDIGFKAVNAALANNNMDASQVDLLATVTSTGLALPGVSGILMRDIGFRGDCQRMDIVGMGCNGGLSGLRNVATALGHLAAIRGKTQVAMLLCCEINSAYFVNRDTTGDGVVNSLFGDGAVALLLSASPKGDSTVTSSSALQSSPMDILSAKKAAPPKISVLDFESLTIPEYFEDMKYNMDKDSQLPHFTLSKRIPQAVGSSVEIPVRRLLDRHGLSPQDISQFVVHGGGKAVMQLVAKGLGLDHDHDLRHTISVIRDYGNISSGSFLVSLERLMQEAQQDMSIMHEGDLVVFIAMGPGATIEAALGVVTASAQIKEMAVSA